MDALVTDAHHRHAVAGLRALGRRGVEAGVLGPGFGSAGLLSRYAAARERGPDAEVDPVGFIAAVNAVARRRGPLVVYPCHECSIDVLLDAGPALAPEAYLPYPGREALDRLRDKAALAHAAQSAGLATPTPSATTTTTVRPSAWST